MKTWIKEFKEFIAQGNAMMMAVGIIIGSAFTAIINSIVNDLLMPIIGLILGGIDFKGMYVMVGDAQILYGNFISAIIIFLITAAVLFSIIKAFNAFKRKSPEPEVEEEPAMTKEEEILTEILTELKKQ